MSQQSLAELAGLSRSTISQIEAGSIKDLSLSRTAAVLEAIGLGLSITPAHPRLKQDSHSAQPLELAARTASVSYAVSMPAELLAEALSSGTLPAGYEPHVGTFLEEAPISLIAKTVEQLHADLLIPREVVWANMREIAASIKATRDIWNA